jgi:methanogenic corrinoid protein MtbC1
MSSVLDQYVAGLVAGNRPLCRQIANDLVTKTDDARPVYREVLWPAMERIEKLYRSDRINAATEHMATRINRAVAHQIQIFLKPKEPNGKRVLITCADGEPEELGAQMCADLFEANGWDVYFLGGGVPNDEILNLVGQLSPDVLLIFGTQPAGVPGVRRLIDLIRGIGVAETMNVMVSGGVFNRADGLWKEVNADLMVRSAHEALPVAETAPPRTPSLRTGGVTRKRRRRRRSPAVAAGVP